MIFKYFKNWDRWCSCVANVLPMYKFPKFECIVSPGRCPYTLICALAAQLRNGDEGCEAGSMYVPVTDGRLLASLSVVASYSDGHVHPTTIPRMYSQLMEEIARIWTSLLLYSSARLVDCNFDVVFMPGNIPPGRRSRSKVSTEHYLNGRFFFCIVSGRTFPAKFCRFFRPTSRRALRPTRNKQVNASITETGAVVRIGSRETYAASPPRVN
jgi:hypothetical protein